MNSKIFLTLCTNVKSKWIKDLDIRPESTGQIEENTDRIAHGSEA